MVQKYGPFVRLWGIQNAQLPAVAATAEELTPFLTAILLEAVPFIDDVPSAKQSPYTSSWQTKGSRNFPHSEAPVYLYERTVSAKELCEVARENHLPGLSTTPKLEPETWFLRRSVHADSATKGTASWQEWYKCFKESHAETEREFTPTVLSTRPVPQRRRGGPGRGDVGRLDAPARGVGAQDADAAAEPRVPSAAGDGIGAGEA
jgi:hypothetical protein